MKHGVLFILLSNRTESTQKTVYTIQHHTLIYAQETDNVIYDITELAR